MVNLFLLSIFNPFVDIWHLEKYDILSFQRTVRDPGIWSENIQGGLQYLSDTFVRHITAETGRLKIEIRGNEKDGR